MSHMHNEMLVELEQLLDETEANIKLLEFYADGFVTSVLNEWRYATRHFLRFAFDAENRQAIDGALAHLRRAHFDSYDFLLVYQVDEIRKYQEIYCDQTDIVKKVIPNYDSIIVALNDAAHLHATVLSSNDRSNYYGKVRELNQTLAHSLSILNETHGTCATLIRRAAKKERMQTFVMILGVCATIVGAIASIVALFNN